MKVPKLMAIQQITAGKDVTRGKGKENGNGSPGHVKVGGGLKYKR